MICKMGYILKGEGWGDVEKSDSTHVFVGEDEVSFDRENFRKDKQIKVSRASDRKSSFSNPIPDGKLPDADKKLAKANKMVSRVKVAVISVLGVVVAALVMFYGVSHLANLIN